MNTSTLQLLIDSAPMLLTGAMMTLQLWLCALGIGLCVGIMWGIATCNRLWIPYLSSTINTLTFVLRGIPFYVQLLIAYFVLPDLIGFAPATFVVGTVSLGLCSAAYIAQITKSGLNAIPQQQWEAAYVLGYNTVQTLRYIVIPQTLRIIIPAIAGECDQLLKSTSILATIGFMELTRIGMNIIAREMIPLPIYASIALLYLTISSLLNLVTKQTEQYLQKDFAK